MRYKLLAIALITACLSSVSAYAGGPDPRTLTKSCEITVGAYVPMYDGIEADAYVGFNYTSYRPSGIGFKYGIQYSPSVVDLANVVGAPVAFTYRTRERSTSERLMSGAYGAADALWHDVWYQRDGIGSSMIAAALASLFSGAEYYVGVTPGVIFEAGMDHGSWNENYNWTERSFPLSLSLDAGMNLNYAIWRFDLKIMPAFHYNLTGNYKVHHVTTDYYDQYTDTYYTSEEVRRARWFFSIGAGLSFRF